MTINRLPRRSFLAMAAGSLAASTFSFDAAAVSAQANSDRPSLVFSLYGMKTLPLDVASRPVPRSVTRMWSSRSTRAT